MSRTGKGGLVDSLNKGILALILALTAWAGGAEINVHLDGQQTLTDAAVDVTESGEQEGLASFQTGSDQAFLGQTGQPQLPFQVLHVMLPPNTNLKKIDLQLRASYVPVEGTWQVAPVPPVATRDENGNEIVVWPSDRMIVDGFDTDVYNTNAFWPAAEASLLSAGQLRRWKLAAISVPLFRYNPVTGQLLELTQADVFVQPEEEKTARYANQTSGRSANMPRAKEHARAIERARNLAVNFEQAAAAYDSASDETDTQMQMMSATAQDVSPAPTLTDTGYVIITTNAIRNASSKLNAFVAHKQAMGFVVNVITETQYGAGSGDTAANNIRAWLRSNYQNSAYGNGGILYVLLIGDPRTNSSSVPMKMCIGDHPTDYYYAELTSDWDADGDGIYGEEEDTKEQLFEVYVGRIPYYGSIGETDSILQKTINYESATDTQWRRRALLPMVPLDDKTPAYHMGEQIKYNLLEPRGIASTRIYEHTYGVSPAPEYTLKDCYPASEWTLGVYGMMIWQTHGWNEGASGIINSGNTPKLNNDYPSAVYQGSCATGEPEKTTNLGYSILKNGGIGTIAASRNGWYWVGESNFTGNGASVGCIGYQYARRLAEGKTIGQAIWDTKEVQGYWQKNYFVYNLYGDPSVTVMPAAPKFMVTPTHGFQYDIAFGKTVSGNSSYTLKNSGTTSMSWTAETDADWFTLSSAGGTINAGGSATLTVQVGPQVATMSPGTHYGTITITNVATGQTDTRRIRLNVHPRGLRGHWKLDELSGTTAYDATPEARHGALKGDTNFETGAVSGVLGRAFLFDGVDDYINLPPLDIYSNEVTISAWVLRDGNQVEKAAIFMSRSGTTVAGINVSSSGRLLYHWNDVSNTYNWSSGLTTPANRAVFVALVVEPTKATMYMYDHGTLYSSVNNVSHNVEEFGGVTRIGHDISNDKRRFKGGIDDVRIYADALSEAEIYALIDGGTAAAPKPYHGAQNVPLKTHLKWGSGSTATVSHVYFGQDYSAVLHADTDSREYMGQASGHIWLPNTLLRLTDYYWRIDEETDAGTVQGPVWRFRTGLGTGGLTRQVWTNISGNDVENLKSNTRYLNNTPDFTEIVSRFEGPTNSASNYGARFYGYFIPPVTGEYVFYIVSDDYSELYLSPTKSLADAEVVAYARGATGTGEWTKFESQDSTVGYPAFPYGIPLVAGRPHFMMALHKEGGGDDHLKVAFSAPGIYRQIMDGQYLMPYAEDFNWGPVFETAQLQGSDALEGFAYQDSVAQMAQSFEGGAVTWSRAAGPQWLQVAPDGTLSGIPGDGDTGLQSFELRATDAAGAFNDMLVKVNVHDTFTGERGLSDFARIAARWLEVGCSDFPACSGADLTGDAGVDTLDLAAMADMWLMEKTYSGLFGYWPFEADASDNCGTNNGVLMNGAAVTSTDAVFAAGRGALALDGINDFVDVPGFKGITGGTSRTCAAWIKTEGMTGNGVIINWGTFAAGQHWLFGVFSDGQLGLYSGGPTIKTHAVVADGRWHHVAAVLYDDGSPSINEVKLYIDGALQTTASTSSQVLNTVPAHDLCIGAFKTATGQTASYFKGLIDDLQLHDRALTAAEIQQLALRDLQLYLPLGETSGVDAADLSVYGRDVQFNAPPQWHPDLGFDGAAELEGNAVAAVSGWKGVSNGASRTCAAWIKTAGSDQNMTILNWGTNELGKQWLMGIFTTGQFAIYSAGTSITADIVVKDDQWHHVAAVLTDDGSPTMDEILLYVDGVLQDVTVVNGAIATGMGDDVSVGSLRLSSGQFGAFYSGLLDEIRVYDRPLSADEIRRLANW